MTRFAAPDLSAVDGAFVKHAGIMPWENPPMSMKDPGRSPIGFLQNPLIDLSAKEFEEDRVVDDRRQGPRLETLGDSLANLIRNVGTAAGGIARDIRRIGSPPPAKPPRPTPAPGRTAPIAAAGVGLWVLALAAYFVLKGK